MSYDVPFGGRMAGQSRPLIPSGEHHGGKGTEEKGDIQGRSFFCTHMHFAPISVDMASLYYPISILLVSV